MNNLSQTCLRIDWTSASKTSVVSCIKIHNSVQESIRVKIVADIKLETRTRVVVIALLQIAIGK